MRGLLLVMALLAVPPGTPARADPPIIVSTASPSLLATICGESKTQLGANFCTGYIVATFDRMSITREVCPGSGVTTEQKVAVGRRFVETHPELWDRHPSYVLDLAFKAAFACPAK